MKFKLYKENGALNSRPVFDAFEQGIKKLGFRIVHSEEDIPVIWSVLWQGRMKANRQVYETAVKNSQPVIIIEVGNLKRGVTWRISVDNVNRLGYFGNDQNLDQERLQKLQIHTKSKRSILRREILIACQHKSSLQWQSMPTMEHWVRDTVKQIRQHSDRKILVRPHPRSPIMLSEPGIELIKPQKVVGTYDDFDIDYNYHCVVNHNSGPSVQAAINGTPIICDTSGLAYPVSSTFDKIEDIVLPDRLEWFLELAHTEWTIEEIKLGIPLSRLVDHLKSRLDR